VNGAGAVDEQTDTATVLFPWPPTGDESIPSAFVRTWRGASLSPRQFFRALPATGSVGSALLYYLPLGIVVAAAQFAWVTVRAAVAPEREAVLGQVELGGSLSPLLEFLFAPLLLLVSLFLAAGVVHLLLRLLGGAHRDYRFTTRVFAFAYSPQLVAIIPVIGAVIGFVWMVVVAIVGLQEGHGTTRGRAAAAVLIPVTIAMAFLAIFAFVARTGSLILH
jgi:hypothetical protein